MLSGVARCVYEEGRAKVCELVVLAYEWYRKCREKPKDEDIEDVQHEYCIDKDILRLYYHIQDLKFCICVPRNTKHTDIRKIYKDIKGEPNEMLQFPIIHATLNDNINITNRLNAYLGNDGSHAEKTGPPKVSWILTPEEQESFKSLYMLTNKYTEVTLKDLDETLKI